MNMDHTTGLAALSAMDVIVGLAVLFSLVFFAVWLMSPWLRNWVEQPKYRFQANLRAYDRDQHDGSTLSKGKDPR